MISVVIPAHNEESTIASLLAMLTEGAEDGEIEIIVSANGCRDGTVDLARSFDRDGLLVRVLELSEGNKPSALNAADAVAHGFPRFYLDSDIETDLAAIRACALALKSGALIVAPQLQVDTTRSSQAVRRYYRVWLTTPWVKHNLVGSGFIGVSASGRSRFASFPSIGADDLWIASHFATHERVVLDGHTFTVRASPNARQLIRRNARIRAANRAIAEQGITDVHVADVSTSWRSLVAIRPRAVDLLYFLTITFLARLAAARMLRRGSIEWHGDRATSEVTLQ